MLAQKENDNTEYFTLNTKPTVHYKVWNLQYIKGKVGVLEIVLKS